MKNAKQNIYSINGNCYAEVPIPDFVDIILKGNDEAMYYLLHDRLNHQLYERYETYRHQLYDDFEDIIEDFFLYLHEHGRSPYQSLKNIKNHDAFETWLLNTFRNYLSNRADEERRIYTIDCTENLAITSQQPLLTDEQMLTIASQLIAYAHQMFYSRSRFIFLRSLLTLLNKQRAMPDKEIAEALGMTHLAYRVTVHRMKQNLTKFHFRLLHGETLHLDEEHHQMADDFNNHFERLYPTLFNYYLQAITTLEKQNEVINLRQQYLDATGFSMHEQSPAITITIKALWNKLNRWILIY